jgi:hypothetical protein
MSLAVIACAALEDLAAFIHHVLCEKDSLDPAQAPLYRTPMRKGSRICGMMFHVKGPHLLQTSAVWSADDDRIIFYDSSGIRFHEARLSESPELNGIPVEERVA